MELTVAERVRILDMLPQQGDFVTLRIIRDLQGDLSFSEEEIKEWDVQYQAGRVLWDEEKAGLKDIAVGERASEIIADALRKLDSENKLHIGQIDLFEKFVKTED